MKKLYSLLAITLFAAGTISAQCTVDPNAQTTPGVNPTADQLPCIIRNQAYDQTLQGKIQDSYDTTILSFAVNIKVDSMRLDSVVGLPLGITWSKTPNLLLGGGNGCVRFTGTTNENPGRYDLTGYGTVWLHVTAPSVPAPIGPIDTVLQRAGNLNNFSPFGGYYVDVINQGDVCHAVGINDFSSDLNTALSVYPNPNNGIFNVALNTGNRVNGTLNVVDVTGKIVFTQSLDVIGLYNTQINLADMPKGIYTLQLKTAEGFASKNISIQ